MDCETFRRRLLIDPADPDPRLRAHAETCPACAREVRRATAFEAQLRRALADETAPQGNAAAHRRPRQLLPALLGLLGLLGVGIWWLMPGPGSGGTEALAATAVAHVRDEIELLEALGSGLTRAQSRPESVALLLEGLGVPQRLRIDGGLAERLRHAGRCVIGTRYGLHLVLQGQRGPVTVLLLPGREIAAQHSTTSKRFDILLAPAGDATLALLGEHGEPLQELAQRLGGAS